MTKVKRVYVEKKPAFAGKARELCGEIRQYLGIRSVEEVRILIRYDVEGVSGDVFETACHTVFSEPPVDELYLEEFPHPEDAFVFSVEYLPGQFDQRADSAEQCICLLSEDEEPIIRTAVTYCVTGKLDQEQREAIVSHCINPVDSRRAEEEKPVTLAQLYADPGDVETLAGFIQMKEEALRDCYASLSLAMTFPDFLHIQKYFLEEERRDPTLTEIRVLDTYWSDHCRHTTFSTELTEVSFGDGELRGPIERTYRQYLEDREALYGGRKDKYVCLMDLAVLAMKKLKAEGKLDDQEVSDEINACSIIVPVDVDGKEEEWLINFKNETHNHPTEIEPFGGAATCLGGAIRDPLSGRTYVYQAMRVTGAADPTVSLKETLKGKLPQKKLVREAAHGYSSYGNQIGLATGYVKEIYHPGYVAKRMEIGAVLGAAPRSAVKRENSDPGDVVILLGGRTGRDGIGGATGSSKVHTESSIEVCGAEVQKGNPPTERKIQRMFRRPEVSLLIKKCNDFGAGGVSVAIGELAAGLCIDLDKVPKKYAGLDGTEIAISESQERMAVVTAPQDVEAFLQYAAQENLEAVPVAVVTKAPRLVMNWRGKTIVDLSRAFLDTNGAHQEARVEVLIPEKWDSPLAKRDDIPDVRGKWLSVLSDLNVCSQKGLVEMFDSSIGASSVLMPYGGRFQLTQTQVMAAKVPVPGGKTETVTLMSYGFDPYLSSWSPFHGAAWAVTESVARIVAAGGDPEKIRFTFQEYFQRMTEDPKRWSAPFTALLGAYGAQIGFGLPSIGGKDSMSGTFNQIDVPPTLVSFAVDVAKAQEVLSPELKKPGNRLVWIRAKRDGDLLPDYADVMREYTKIYADHREGKIVSAYAIDGYGIAAAAARMAFGNGLGVKIEHNLDPRDFFAPGYGDLLLEVPPQEVSRLSGTYTLIGEVLAEPVLRYGSLAISIEEALDVWKAPLAKVFPAVSSEPAFTSGEPAEPSERMRPIGLMTQEELEERMLEEESGTLAEEPEPEEEPEESEEEAVKPEEEPEKSEGEAVKPEEETAGAETEPVPDDLYRSPSVYVCRHRTAKPRVFIPVFPGTNCEYDSAAAFERAGAEPHVQVFRNLSAQDIRDSVEVYSREIGKAQIVMFPGGFSGGDEPDGSAKFFAAAFRNEKLKEAVMELLSKRDGLVLGICNGFQALIKLGLVPYGEIRGQAADAPTLTFNTIGRHISRMVYTKVVSDKSPWLQKAELGGVYVTPASHGEGRFVADKEWIRRLFANGQVATRYTDPDGNVLADEEWNVNGSYFNIEGITSPDGRVYGKMAHCERRGPHVAINISGEQDMKLFEAGVEYFR